MKSLHKKISAVVLAGMIVVGGCLASGVSAHADVYMGDIARLEKKVQYSYEDVVEICKEKRIKILAVSNSSKLLSDYIKEEYSKKDAHGRRNGKFKNGQVVKRLLKGPKIRLGDAESFKVQLKFGKNFFEDGKVQRISIGILEYILYSSK